MLATYATPRNYRNRACTSCGRPTPHDEAGCVLCAALEEERARQRNDMLVFWLVLAPLGVVGLVLSMAM